MEELEGTSRTVESREEPAYGSFKSGVALTFATCILMFVGGVGSSVVVARWLGPEGLGTLAVLNVTVALALQIGCGGLPSANTYFIARDRRTLGPVWANALIFALTGGFLLGLFGGAFAGVRAALFGGVFTKLPGISALPVSFQRLSFLVVQLLLLVVRSRVVHL